MDIRLLINQIDKASEVQELEIENVESEVNFLREIKIIVDSFNEQITKIEEKNKINVATVCIFDGKSDQNVSYSNTQEQQAKQRIHNKFEILTMKKLIISDHLE